MSLSILDGFKDKIKLVAKRRKAKQRSKLERQFWITHLVKAGAQRKDATHDARLLLREGLHLHDQASVDVMSQELLEKLGIRCKACILSLCQKPLPSPPDYSTLEVSSGDRSAVNVNRVYTGGLRRTSTTSACVEDTCVAFGKFTRRKWSCHAHEVVPGIWLGNHFASLDKKNMLELGITGVVQCREHDPPHAGTFQYLTLPLWDGDGHQNIKKYFERCNKFITSHLPNPLPHGSTAETDTTHDSANSKENITTIPKPDAKASSPSACSTTSATPPSATPPLPITPSATPPSATPTSATPTSATPPSATPPSATPTSATPPLPITPSATPPLSTPVSATTSAATTYTATPSSATPSPAILSTATPAPAIPGGSAARSGGVLVHCVRGASRSATIVMAYLMSRGCALQEALALTKRARPVANPKRGFMTQLTEYAQELKGLGPGPNAVFRDLTCEYRTAYSLGEYEKANDILARLKKMKKELEEETLAEE